MTADLGAQAASTDAAEPGGRARRDLGPLRALAPFVRAHRADAVAATMFLVVSVLGTISLTFAARGVADRGLASHAAHSISLTFAWVAGAVLVLAAGTAGRFYFSNRLAEKVTADLRAALYAHVLTLDAAFFATTLVGEVISRLTADLAMVEAMLGATVSVALRNLATVVIAFIVLIVIDARLTGFVILLALAVVVPMVVVGRGVRRRSAAAQARFAEAVAFAGESLEALETVQAFGQERAMASRFAEAVHKALTASIARIGARAVMTGMTMVLVAGGVGLVLWRASLAAFVDHTLSPGALLQFVFLSALGAGSAGSLSETWGDVQKSAGAMERIVAILAARPTIAAPPWPRPLPRPARGEIALERVVFSYPGRPGAPALAGFDLHVAAGERVALVGPSGAGKSTVFRLLLRLYDPDEGVVRIDGVDLREADPAEVRARIALVAQEAPLFSGSAADNLQFGDQAAAPERLAEAARAAQAEGFIQALPQGFDTPLGERGRSLSGGERQRLAIARALVRNSPILLMDEATSALDSHNEQRVQKALASAMRGRTSLVIAHRLSTVLDADRIVVMEAGQVVECGRHADLVAAGGLYARLAELQFAGEA